MVKTIIAVLAVVAILALCTLSLYESVERVKYLHKQSIECRENKEKLP